MNTDPTTGSSGSATPTDLTDRLNANLDDRGRRLSVAPPPLSDILHRSRRRQNRRHAAGVLAGAGALALSGVAIVARPQPDTDLVTQTAGEQTPGTVGTTVPAAELASRAHAADDRCPNPETWYLGLRATGTDRPGSTPMQLDAVTWAVLDPSAGAAWTQAYLSSPDAVDGKALTISRTAGPTSVPYVRPGTTPPTFNPDDAIFTGRSGLVVTHELGRMEPRYNTPDPVTIGGFEGLALDLPDGLVSIQWRQGPDFMRVSGRQIPKEELVAIATQLQRRPDGGFDVPNLPDALVPVMNTGQAEPTAAPQSLSYGVPDQSVTITVRKATHDQFLLHLLERTWGRPQRRPIRGEDGWIMTHDGQPADLAIWYDHGHGAFATVALSTPTGVAAPGQLDRVLDQLVDLDAGEVSTLCAQLAAQRAADAADAAAPPAAGSFSPWTAPADGSSSPGTTSPGDGSSSPWTAPTVDPAHDDHGGSASPWVDPTATTTTTGPPLGPPPASPASTIVDVSVTPGPDGMSTASSVPVPGAPATTSTIPPTTVP